MRALLVAAGILSIAGLLTTGPAPSLAQESPGWGEVAPTPGDNPPVDERPASGKGTDADGGGAGTQVTPPRNDAMVTPRLASTPYTVQQSNVGAGLEVGEETLCGSSPIGSTLWYEWKAPAPGLYMFTSSGSDFDTVIALYDDNFNQLACSDDSDNGFLSVVRFEAQQGATYYLQAGGYDTSQGNMKLLAAPIVGARDEAGDAFNSGVHDLLKAEAAFTRQQSNDKSVLLRFEFADAVSPPHVGGDRAITGIIDLDTNLSSGQGSTAWRNQRPGPHPQITMIDEYYVALSYEASHPGEVAVHNVAGAVIATAPIVFRPQGFTIELSLSDLGFPSDLAYAGIFEPVGQIETDVFPNADPPPRADCSAPLFADPESDGECIAATGLWHEELPAPPQGMAGSTLAYNFGCNGIQALSGCQYNTGSRTFGTATLRPIGPLPAGAQVWFKNMRVVSDGPSENTCPYDFTRVKAGADGSIIVPLAAAPGGSTIVDGKICGSSAIDAHDIIAPLVAGTRAIAFEFDTSDEFGNLGAGQFIDQIVVCPPEIACDTDSDFCPDGAEQGTDPAFGGARNWWDRWDFFDVNGNGNVDLSDTLAVLALFGLTPGNPGYDELYDRTVPNTSEPWRTAAATGTAVGIDLNDALANLSSFGHNCSP